MVVSILHVRGQKVKRHGNSITKCKRSQDVDSVYFIQRVVSYVR